MNNKVLAVSLLVVLSLSCARITAQPLSLTIWVDKGCGGEYFVGDMLSVHWTVNHGCEISFWEVEPDGKKRKIATGPVFTGAGDGNIGWTLKDYGYGKRAVYAEAASIQWGSDTAECEFYVRKKAADVDVTVKDQEGIPIPGVTVKLDGAIVETTGDSGRVTIPEVEFGEHTITVELAGEEKSSRIRIASTQRQYMDFVFTVEKRGSITVRVYDQNGSPLSNADISLDGVREGATSQDGTLTLSALEGSHNVEAAYEGETAQKSVTVVKNQTSFADLTIHLAVETTLVVFVRDDTGNAIADANVYLDTLFMGKTDAQGKIEQAVTPGFHAVRAEKEGYDPVTQNTTVEEGKTNSVKVVIPEKKGDAPAYGVLVILGFLFLLKKRH